MCDGTRPSGLVVIRAGTFYDGPLVNQSIGGTAWAIRKG